MKKLFISLAVAMFAVCSANAADGVNNAISTVKNAYATSSPRAVGLRLGYGASVTYQHGLADGNMIGIDLDLPGFVGIGLTATYDWINPCGAKIPWNNKGEFNWYAGAGLSGGFIFANYGFFGLTGRVGVEYNFWFPLQLAAEYRPTLGCGFGSTIDVDGRKQNYAGFFPGGLYAGAIAICVRYKF